MKNTFLFDFDGTLVDSMPYWYACDEEYLILKGIKPEENIHEVLWPFSVFETANYYHDYYGVDKDPNDIVDEIYEIMGQHYLNDINFRPGVKDLILDLKSKGNKVGILTLTSESIVRKSLIKEDLNEGIFDLIITTMDTGMSKQEPEIYNVAMQKLGSKPEETVMVEDSLYALKVAKTTGLTTVGVYEDMSKHNWCKIKEVADYAIEDFSKWPKLL